MSPVEGFAPCASCGGELLEQRVGLVPVDAGVGNALAVGERLTGNELLRAGNQIALEHHPDYVRIAPGNLGGDVSADNRLTVVILAAVSVAAVNHDARLKPGLLHGF